MAPLADASATSLRAFLADPVEPGTTVITEGRQGYHGIGELGYSHHRRSQRAARARGEDVGELLPLEPGTIGFPSRVFSCATKRGSLSKRSSIAVTGSVDLARFCSPI